MLEEKSNYQIMLDNFDDRAVLFENENCEIFVIKNGYEQGKDTLWRLFAQSSPDEVPDFDDDDAIEFWLDGTGIASKDELIELTKHYYIWS